MRALNFYSPQHHEQLRQRRKKCTIRLGDKAGKYAEGDVVWITVGKRYQPKQKIFTAVIDRVLVKPIAQLTSEDIQGENPDGADVKDVLAFLEGMYDKTMTPTDKVTVVYFSEIIA
ncbi:MAG: RNA-binding protein [Sporomusaceae bacterium]|nr:RNA-binding protein [Sporomusaceae bacterium]